MSAAGEATLSRISGARYCFGFGVHSPSPLIFSLLHSHVNLEWCDEIKLSNLLLPRKSGSGFRVPGCRFWGQGFVIRVEGVGSSFGGTVGGGERKLKHKIITKPQPPSLNPEH